jgi:predicted 3-demethylubiquinone-9 3-methyltransferase (glyoxalase superfamily)
MPNFTTCLWFDTQAEDAAKFYTSIFPNSKVTNVSRYGKNQPGPEGQVMVVNYDLNGQSFMGLNGGPVFPQSEAYSQVVRCKDQAEIDHYWDKLLEGGGKPSQCGWLKDKFGLSWQIVPEEIGDLMTKGGQKKSDAVMQAVLQMVKLDLGKMREAYNRA